MAILGITTKFNIFSYDELFYVQSYEKKVQKPMLPSFAWNGRCFICPTAQCQQKMEVHCLHKISNNLLQIIFTFSFFKVESFQVQFNYIIIVNRFWLVWAPPVKPHFEMIFSSSLLNACLISTYFKYLSTKVVCIQAPIDSNFKFLA